MTKEEFKQANPICVWLADKGVVLHGGGNARVTNRCPIKDHKPNHFCVTVDDTLNLWKCNDHDQGGDIYRWMALEQGKPDGDCIKSVCGENGRTRAQLPKPGKSEPVAQATIKKTYSYEDVNGFEVYQVVRLEPKSFRQRNKVDGKWIWNMTGISRVLYRTPQIMGSDTVVVCEGEKDADTVTALGWVGTTNVGGATNWLDSYADTLAGKNVIICPDTDEKGQEHKEVVLKSIQGKAKSVRCLKVPGQFKDVTEWLGETPTPENKVKFGELIESSPVLIRGIEIPIETMAEGEQKFLRQLRNVGSLQFDLSSWLAELHGCSLMAGELATIIASTGVGKTYTLINIALAAKPMPTVLFEMELPSELLYERTLAVHMRWGQASIREAYSGGETLGQEGLSAMGHMFQCCASGLTVEAIERHINNAELKMGVRPRLVLIDYIQLIQGPNKSRFDNISDAAEQLKVIAKTTQTIIIMTSQMGRKLNGQTEVFLNDAKQSGSIENSSGLVLGMWRDDPDNKSKIKIRVLKNSKGEAGKLIECYYKPGLNGAFTGKIVGQEKVDMSDYKLPFKD